MALAMAAVTFTSCEDVPAPYDYPGNGGEDIYFNQSFATDLGEFQSFGTNDNIAWTIDYSSACITGYKDFDGDGTKTNEAGVTYLVSPEIDLTKASKAYIEMNHAMKYERADVNANNTLLISKDYTDDPTKATWTSIAYPTTGLNDASTKEFVFVTSAANIPAEFIGQKVRIAFRHTCTESQSSTWEVKSLAVKEGEAENGGATPPAGAVGDGTEANPYIVTDIITNGASGSNVFVKAYIVGFVPDKAIDEAKFTAEGCEAASNVIVAASADETSVSNVMPVQLPFGDVRTGVNLKDNPGNIKQEVLLCGNVETYFGKTGLKSVVWAKIGGKEFGIKPGTDIPIVGTPKGAGTKEDPFNVAAANKYIKDGGDATVEKYVKGKISELKEFRSEYGSISYYISEDGTTANQFYVFGGNNLGGTKFTKLEELKVGDEVVICGKLKNYNGTYEFDSKNYLVSLNGKKAETGGGEVTPPAPTGDNLLANGNCETWDGTTPVNWKTTSTAGNASLKQSTDAHGGSYSISVGFNEKQNKRLGYKEITLKAGTYKFSFYAKSTTADASQCRPGYVVVTDGVADKNYNYSTDYASLNNSTWTLVSYEFTLTETKTICLVVMNPKTTSHATAQNILVDDASLVTSNGGFAE